MTLDPRPPPRKYPAALGSPKPIPCLAARLTYATPASNKSVGLLKKMSRPTLGTRVETAGGLQVCASQC